MNFLKNSTGDWDNNSIAFYHDVALLTSDKSFENPSFKKLIDFLNLNDDVKNLLLDYSKEKYEQWARLLEEYKRIRMEYLSQLKETERFILR